MRYSHVMSHIPAAFVGIYVLKEMSRACFFSQNELGLLVTWVAELENDYAALEHDYLHMESLMPDEVSFALRNSN